MIPWCHPRSSFPLTSAKEQEQCPNHGVSRLFSVTVGKHFIWKTREPFPLQPACGVVRTWKLSLSGLVSSSWKSCSPWVTALFMCLQVCGRRGPRQAALAAQHLWWSPGERETLEPPGELLRPPPTLKCAYPWCDATTRPWLKIAWEPKPTFAKKRTNKLSFCHPPPLCAATGNQMK